MIIAVDFDGTIVEHEYPRIGKPKPFAFDTLRKLQREDHHQLILWTARTGELLQEAVDFCEQNGVFFYAVNAAYPEEEETMKLREKIHADVFIDDHNLGGLPDWGVIYNMIHSGQPLKPYNAETMATPKKKTWWQRLRQYLFCILLSLSCSPLFAQMSVKNFVELPNDMTARVTAPVIDQNGKKCALIKIITTQQDFLFDVGMLGVQRVVQKTAEIWVYVPERTAKIKIMHPTLGQLETGQPDHYYWFPTGNLREATVYSLELTTDEIEVTVKKKKIPTGFLVITSEPDGADVFITQKGVETYAGTTPFQQLMEYDTYYFRVVKNLYHVERGMANLNSNLLEMPVTLRPKFGSLSVTSTPNGARVTIEGIDKEYRTPCTIERIPSGEHTVRLMMDRYSPAMQIVTIQDGQTAQLNIPLQARFAVLTIKTLDDADIYINGKRQGEAVSNRLTIELNEGIYEVEARLAAHKSVTEQVQVIANQPKTIELRPRPIYGSLVVMTNPMKANVTLNGQSYGTTPLSLDELLIGTYTLTLSKDGCASVTKSITITQDETTNISETLPTGKEITITTGASGDKIYIDNQYVGLSPLTQTLSFGEHSSYAERNGKRCSAKTLNVTQTGAANVSLSFAQNMTCTANGVSFEMVYVEGGTFTMGCTDEQGSDCYDNESPAHEVTLSDYYIGKYEVTQELWQVVMGTTVSQQRDKADTRWLCGEGANLPMYYISWTDCQNFIKKLNTICHQNGTLPADKNFYLPTEAQWEYAARGGKKSKGYKYSGSNNLHDVAWFGQWNGETYDNGNSGEKMHPVGTQAPNELGIYDMSGNVSEWCSDWYSPYSSRAQTNPKGGFSDNWPVYRGGCIHSKARFCRVSRRGLYLLDNRYSDIGLRLSVH